MQLKNLLTKSLLLAGMLAGSSSAWGDATTVYERGGTGTAWSDADASTWTGTTGDGYSVTKTDAGLAFALNFDANGRYAYEYSHSLTTSDDYKVTMNAVWAAGSPTGKVNANNSFLKFGNVTLRLYGQNSKLTIQMGSSDAVDLMVGSADGNNSTLRSKDFNVTITINKKTKAVNYSVSCSAWNSGTAVTGSGVLTDASVSSVGIGYDRGGQQLRSFSQTLKSINITEEEDASATADYTIKYVAEISGIETEIKTADTRTGVVGDDINILEADKNSITYNDVKYLYSSNDASGKTIADDNSTVVTVSFEEAPTYTYTATDNLGNTLASGSAYEGNDVYFYVPYYVFNDNKFYLSPTVSSGTLAYGQVKITGISANTSITVTYTEEDESNVVFFSEAENLSGVTPFEDGYTQTRMSNGKVGYYESETAFTTLPAGIYTLTSATRSGSTTFYAGEVGSGTEIMSITSGGAVTTETSDQFILTEPTDIYTSAGNTSKYIDYVIIRKIGDATVSKSISDAGWATYCSPYALDLENATGLEEAYIVTDGAAGVLTKTSVKGGTVPANTGLLLKGDEGTVTIPVVASSATDVSANKLVGVTANTNIDANAGYVLMATGSNGLGFYENSNAFTVGANTAYLPAGFDGSSDAPAFFSLFGGETTAISAVGVDTTGTNKEGVFNLNGQRVAQPTKGLYIVGGKKVVVK